MHRIYLETPVRPEDSIIKIQGSSFHYLAEVLRLKRGDRFIAFWPDGRESELEVIEKRSRERILMCRPGEWKKASAETAIEIDLYAGILKGKRFNYSIQKSCELGVRRIIPFISERVNVRFSTPAEPAEKRQRWQKIAVNACQQCGRNLVPAIGEIREYRDIISGLAGTGNAIIFDSRGEELRSVLKKTGKVKECAVIIGPEGGFSRKELDLALGRGIRAASLGFRVLRAETVPVVTLAILRYEWNDMG